MCDCASFAAYWAGYKTEFLVLTGVLAQHRPMLKASLLFQFFEDVLGHPHPELCCTISVTLEIMTPPLWWHKKSLVPHITQIVQLSHASRLRKSKPSMEPRCHFANCGSVLAAFCCCFVFLLLFWFYKPDIYQCYLGRETSSDKMPLTDWSLGQFVGDFLH